MPSDPTPPEGCFRPARPLPSLPHPGSPQPACLLCFLVLFEATRGLSTLSWPYCWGSSLGQTILVEMGIHLYLRGHCHSHLQESGTSGEEVWVHRDSKGRALEWGFWTRYPRVRILVCPLLAV